MSFGGCTLGRGLTLVHFHSCGRVPSLRLLLKIAHTGASMMAQSYRIQFGMSSGPTTLFALIRDRSWLLLRR